MNRSDGPTVFDAIIRDSIKMDELSRDKFLKLVTLQPSEAIFGGGRCGSVLCARYCSIAWTTV